MRSCVAIVFVALLVACAAREEGTSERGEEREMIGQGGRTGPETDLGRVLSYITRNCYPPATLTINDALTAMRAAHPDVYNGAVTEQGNEQNLRTSVFNSVRTIASMTLGHVVTGMRDAQGAQLNLEASITSAFAQHAQWAALLLEVSNGDRQTARQVIRNYVNPQ